MDVLITGGAGEIGRNIRAAMPADATVTTFDQAGGGGVDIAGDVIDPDAVTDAATDADMVLHLAAMTDIDHAQEHPKQYYEVNVRGTYNVCRAVADTDTDLLFLSSREVYGESRNASESDELDPKNVYGRSKAAAEGIVRFTCDDATILRPTNVFGTGTDVVSTFSRRMEQGEPLEVRGNPTMDLIHIEDVKFILREFVETRPGGVFNLGSGQAFDLDAIIDILAGERDVDIHREPLPDFYVSEFTADVSKLRERTDHHIRDQEEWIREMRAE
ncbi:MAG: NAD(P)-dependent oxidoreductase [Candidatus Nanohaloarchaea archaeon]|nr:NAD(P)-dependent oxidoreductase [Candidatus Nanohaloarchaea archaeon]